MSLEPGTTFHYFMHQAVHAFIAKSPPPSLMPGAAVPALVPTG